MDNQINHMHSDYWPSAGMDGEAIQQTSGWNDPHTPVNNARPPSREGAVLTNHLAPPDERTERDRYIDETVLEQLRSHIQQKMILGREEFAQMFMESVREASVSQGRDASHIRDGALSTWDKDAAAAEEEWRVKHEMAARETAGKKWDSDHAAANTAALRKVNQPGSRTMETRIRTLLPASLLSSVAVQQGGPGNSIPQLQSRKRPDQLDPTEFRNLYLPAQAERSAAKNAMYLFRCRDAARRAAISRCASMCDPAHLSSLRGVPSTRRKSFASMMASVQEAVPRPDGTLPGIVDLHKSFLEGIAELNGKPGRDEIVSGLAELGFSKLNSIAPSNLKKTLEEYGFSSLHAHSDKTVPGLSAVFRHRIAEMSEVSRVTLIKRLINLISEACNADHHPLAKRSIGRLFEEFVKLKKESDMSEIDLPLVFWLYREETALLHR